MKRRRARNAGEVFKDFKLARAAAAKASKQEGRLIVARKAAGGGYVLGPVKLPNKRRASFFGLSMGPAPRQAHGRSRKALRKHRRKMKTGSWLGRYSAGILGNPKASPAQRAKASLVMREFYAGRLKDSHGRKVTDRRQAQAIAMSESGQSYAQNPRRRRHFRNARRVIRRRKRNEAPQIIGTAPSLSVKGGGTLHFPLGRLRAGPGPHSVSLDTGGAKAPAPGSKVVRIEYDDPAKAVSAYGRIDRFTHACRSPFIVGPASNGSVALTSKSIAWKGE